MTKHSWTTCKITRKSLAHYMVTIILAAFFGLVPMVFGVEIMPEYSIITALCGFIGKLGKAKKKPFVFMLLGCAIIGVGIIFLGVIITTWPYQSIAYFGALYAMVVGAFLGSLILFIEYMAL